ncbi:hypothetical protein, partial [Chryseobacterium sp. SIMBA_028]|uniref:hypothetical protein n=1 Tax=Chryseobacterium sp. SIMBA_028 TaxID=3085771 RepID=UPI003977FBE9
LERADRDGHQRAGCDAHAEPGHCKPDFGADQARRTGRRADSAKVNGTRVYQQFAVDCLRTLRQIDDA